MKLFVQCAFICLFGIGLGGVVAGDNTIAAIGLGGTLGFGIGLWAWGEDF
jgi:hypothetical protein